MAQVEQLLGGLDDRGDDPRLADDAAARQHRAAADPLRDLAQLEGELRRPRERVAALIHRRRAGVRGLASPGDPVALDPERPEHRAERQPERLEHRPLLDVQLQIGGSALELRARFERPVELDPVLAQRVRKRHPVAVAQLAQLVLVGHRSRRRRGAEERAPEAGALLVGPVDEPDRDGRRPLAGDPAQHLDRGDEVQAAVEPAAVRDRVDVASEQQRPIRVAAQRPPAVAGLVHLGLERQALELRCEPLLGPGPRRRPGDALGAVLVAGELAQLAQLGDRPARGERP